MHLLVDCLVTRWLLAPVHGEQRTGVLARPSNAVLAYVPCNTLCLSQIDAILTTVRRWLTCVACAGLLQDYSTRKVLERTVKGITHDKAAISVAPPKAYARRFLEFVTHR